MVELKLNTTPPSSTEAIAIPIVQVKTKVMRVLIAYELTCISLEDRSLMKKAVGLNVLLVSANSVVVNLETKSRLANQSNLLFTRGESKGATARCI